MLRERAPLLGNSIKMSCCCQPSARYVCFTLRSFLFEALFALKKISPSFFRGNFQRTLDRWKPPPSARNPTRQSQTERTSISSCSHLQLEEEEEEEERRSEEVFPPSIDIWKSGKVREGEREEEREALRVVYDIRMREGKRKEREMTPFFSSSVG